MKFTPSIDGVERLTISVKLRFSKDDFILIKKLARKSKVPWKKWVQSHSLLGVENELINAEED